VDASSRVKLSHCKCNPKNALRKLGWTEG
jgi:hypothetical protein